MCIRDSEKTDDEDSTMQGLGERTAELTEDIQEMQDLKEALSQEESEEEVELTDIVDTQEEL